MKHHPIVVALTGFYVVIFVTWQVGKFGLTLLPLVFAALAEIVWGQPSDTDAKGGRESQRDSPPTVAKERSIQPAPEANVRASREPSSTYELIVAYQGGDRGAMGPLVDQEYRWLLGVCREIAGRDEAPGLANETWIRIMRNLDALRDPAAFRAWARTIASSVHRSQTRSEVSARARDTRWHDEPRPEIDIDTDRVAFTVWLESLDEASALIVKLKVVHLLPWREVGAEMRRIYPDGKWSQKSCKRRLRLLWKEDGGQLDGLMSEEQ